MTTPGIDRPGETNQTAPSAANATTKAMSRACTGYAFANNIVRIATTSSATPTSVKSRWRSLTK